MQYTKETKKYINTQINIYQTVSFCGLPKLNTHKGLKDFLLYLGRIGKEKRDKDVLRGNKRVIDKLK
jgi:hypothetical protein